MSSVFFRGKRSILNTNEFKLSFQISSYTMTSYNLGPDNRPELMEEVLVLSDKKNTEHIPKGEAVPQPQGKRED